MLELPRALSQSQRAEREPLPPVLPSAGICRGTSRRAWQAAWHDQSLLLTAALEGTGELGVLEAAGDGVYRIDDLAPAEQDQLVQVTSSRRVVFRHPLIRSAVVDATTAAERRSAHRALAAASSNRPDRRAWHLGEATTGADEQVAGVLEDAALRLLPRGDYQSVVSLLTRAADLSLDPAERGRRLAAAAYIGAESTGEMRSTAELLEGSRRAGGQASHPCTTRRPPPS